MPSFQCRELLAKSKVFKKQRASGVEQAKDRAKQESENVCHAVLLQRLACETQCSILLKSRADRILARHKRRSGEYEAKLSVGTTWLDDESGFL